MLNNAGLWQLIRQTCTHLSLTLCCPCLLFQKWWMGKYLSLCVIRWPINRSKVGGFHSYTHTHTHTQTRVCTIPHTPCPFISSSKRETCSQTQTLLLPFSLSGFVWPCFSVQPKKNHKEGWKKKPTKDSLLGQFFFYRNQPVVFSHPLSPT